MSHRKTLPYLAELEQLVIFESLIGFFGSSKRFELDHQSAMTRMSISHISFALHGEEAGRTLDPIALSSRHSGTIPAGIGDGTRDDQVVHSHMETPNRDSHHPNPSVLSQRQKSKSPA